MKRFVVFFFAMVITLSASSQKYMTKTGFIGFFSHTPIEDIKADNNQVAAVMDVTTGEIVFQALIRSFHFEKALMEEHFNENYMESEKFPKSTFRGKITNISTVDLKKTGTYPITAEGDLTIRDVTKKITVSGEMEVTKGDVNCTAKFNITPEDYGIEIPKIVRDNIAKNIEVSVAVRLAPVSN